MIDPKVDFYLQGDWIDKTIDVRNNPSIKIVAGSKDENPNISPTRCTFTLNDPNGDWNPRNPLGQYFGELGKNTPVRVRVPLLEDNVSETDTDGWGAKWDNGTSSGGTVSNTNWTRTGTTNVHSVPAANAYRRSLLKDQYLDSCLRATLTMPTNDIDGNVVWSEFEFRYVDTNNYLSVQFIFNTDQTVVVQVNDVIAGSSRVLLGKTAIAGLDLLADQTFELAALVEGQVVRTKIWVSGDPEPVDWQTVCTRASVRYGKTGILSLIAASNTNTKPFAFSYSNVSVEARPFVGEVTEFAAGVGDQSHAAPYVQITASGITQRTIQGSEPLDSTMTRYWTSANRWIRTGFANANLNAPNNNTFRTTDASVAGLAVGQIFRLTRQADGNISGFYYAREDQMFTITGMSSSGGNTTITFTPDATQPVLSGDQMVCYQVGGTTPLAYWPCEDGKGTVQIGSGLVGGQPMVPIIATPKYGESDTFPGSAPILKFNNSEFNGIIPDYINSNQAFTFHMLFHYPADTDPGTGDAIVQMWTDSSGSEVWVLRLTTTGSDLKLDVLAIDTNGTGTLFLHTYDISNLRDKPTMLVFSAKHTGASTVVYSFTNYWYAQDGTTTSGGITNVTATGVTNLGKLKRLQFNPAGGYMETAVGHIGVFASYLEAINLRDAPGGMTGEAPIRRFNRLGYEEQVPIVYCEGSDPTSFMGPQQRATLLDNWKAVAEFDLGRFYESRGAYSFEYRARSSLYNQPYFIDVDYTDKAVVDLDTSDDDQQTRNDITVKQQNGSSYRVVDETSALSVLPPGQGGVGRYTSAPEVSTLSPTQLPGLATWRLGLGTVDEERYPAVAFKPLSGSVELAQIFSCGIGNRFRVTNLSARGKYEPVDQLVSGYTLTLHRFAPTLSINGVPSSPYNVAELDATATRLDSESSVLAEDLDATETGVDVTTTGAALWTTSGADFPLDVIVGGERMTVSNITGSSNPQTFTVTRSVNGVSKTHSAGAKISLADPVNIPL